MEIDKAKTAAFTGYRNSKMLSSDKTPNLLESVSKKVYQAVKLLHEQNSYNTFLSGMAEGFDMLAAEAVLQAKKEFPTLRLIAVIPFRGQEKAYTPDDRSRYRKICENADEIVFTGKEYKPNSFFVRNDFLIQNCSYVICYYTGIRGGTMYTFNRAEKASIPIINIAEGAPYISGKMNRLF